MKLIIDIPDRIIDGAKTNPNFYPTYDFEIIWKAIRNGIPHETVTEFADRCRECGRERVLDKIRAEIEQTVEREMKEDEKWALGLRYSLQIIDKYRNEVSK